MKKILTIVLSVFVAALIAYAGTYTTNLNLYKPSSGESGWATAVNSNWDLLDSPHPALCAVHLASDQTFTHNSLNFVNWSVNDSDLISIHSVTTNPSNFTIPPGYNFADVTFYLIVSASSSTYNIDAQISKNNVYYAKETFKTDPSWNVGHIASAPTITVTGGDILEMAVYNPDPSNNITGAGGPYGIRACVKLYK
jgi:hypothetical protein